MDEIKTPLDAAVRSYAAESRRDLDEHPSIAELSAYHGGESSPAAVERLRDHLAACHECADLVLDFAAFPRLQPPAGHEPVSVREVEAAWSEMGPGLLSAPAAETPPEALPDSAPEPEPAPRRWWNEIQMGLSWMFGSPRLAYGLAAVCLLAVPLTRYWTVHELSRPDWNMTIHGLDVQRAGSAPHEIAIPEDARQSVLVLNLVAESAYSDYVVELLDPSASDAPRWRRKGLQPSSIGNFVLLLPRQFLPAGSYLIRISGRREESTEVVSEYEVRIRYGDQDEER